MKISDRKENTVFFNRMQVKYISKILHLQNNINKNKMN